MTRKQLLNHFEKHFYAEFDFNDSMQLMLVSFLRRTIDKIPGIEFLPYKEIEGYDVAITLTPESLLELICLVCGIRVEDLKRQRRGKQPFVTAKQLYCYFSKLIFGNSYSLKYLGSVIGGKDHTSVIHSINKAKDLIDTDDYSFMVEYEKVYKQIKTLTAA